MSCIDYVIVRFIFFAWVLLELFCLCFIWVWCPKIMSFISINSTRPWPWMSPENESPYCYQLVFLLLYIYLESLLWFHLCFLFLCLWWPPKGGSVRHGILLRLLEPWVNYLPRMLKYQVIVLARSLLLSLISTISTLIRTCCPPLNFVGKTTPTKPSHHLQPTPKPMLTPTSVTPWRWSREVREPNRDWSSGVATSDTENGQKLRKLEATYPYTEAHSWKCTNASENWVSEGGDGCL